MNKQPWLTISTINTTDIYKLLYLLRCTTMFISSGPSALQSTSRVKQNKTPAINNQQNMEVCTALYNTTYSTTNTTNNKKKKKKHQQSTPLRTTHHINKTTGGRLHCAPLTSGHFQNWISLQTGGSRSSNPLSEIAHRL